MIRSPSRWADLVDDSPSVSNDSTPRSLSVRSNANVTTPRSLSGESNYDFNDDTTEEYQCSPRTSEGYWMQMVHSLSSFTDLDPTEMVEKVRTYINIEVDAGLVTELFIKRYFKGACSCLDDDGCVLANACWPWLPHGFVVWLFRNDGSIRERYYKPFFPPRKKYPREVEMPLLWIADLYIQAKTLLPECMVSQDDTFLVELRIEAPSFAGQLEQTKHRCD